VVVPRGPAHAAGGGDVGGGEGTGDVGESSRHPDKVHPAFGLWHCLASPASVDERNTGGVAAVVAKADGSVTVNSLHDGRNLLGAAPERFRGPWPGSWWGKPVRSSSLDDPVSC